VFAVVVTTWSTNASIEIVNGDCAFGSERGSAANAEPSA
jgi:hypothetical protein